MLQCSLNSKVLLTYIKYYLWLFPILFSVSYSYTQTPSSSTKNKYLVLLNTKQGNSYSLDQPELFLSKRAIERRIRQNIKLTERDLPVNADFVREILQTGAKIWFTSRWLNAVLIETDSTTLSKILKFSFVKGLEYNRPLSRARQSYLVSEATANKFGNTETLNYGPSLNQINQIGADLMHKQGFRGENMLVAVLDAGFYEANKVEFLKPLFDERRIVSSYDFVDKENDVYDDDVHGLNVLSLLAATTPNILYGVAYKASFSLIRTEDRNSETRLEEANWLFGAEYADSLGADIINSSLGYSRFDNNADNYTYNDLDGKTTLVSRAAQWATETGMVVVVSAGNEGNGDWRYVTAPADALSVLSVGAVDYEGFPANFSSFGPLIDGRVKPDLAAAGVLNIIGTISGKFANGNGTSFAAPLVAGLAAGFWQAHPELTASDITTLLRRSGSRYNQPDNRMGYGIPNFKRASDILYKTDQINVYPNPFGDRDEISVRLLGLNLGTTVNVTLSNNLGKIIWTQIFLNEMQKPFSFVAFSLSPGFYYLTFTTTEYRRTVKVLKI